MTNNEARCLIPGDIVYWFDPDDGLCSRFFTITAVDIQGDGSVLIWADDDSTIEALPSELSFYCKPCTDEHHTVCGGDNRCICCRS